ncbi:MAG: TetR/AcrR family transcriptional regulator [Paracoccaceae bacterium]|nr:TetR/AcrR family transcriptional regulator [Paracoccaceae bacterium]
MPFERQFDSDAALEKAMQAFWANGYEATSMQDLVDCMGVGRGSLYGAFGGKRSLFLRALSRYDEHYRQRWTDRLAGGPSPRGAILAAFDDVAEAAMDGTRKGCLLVNTALEMSPHDPEVAAAVDAALAQMEDFFRQMIRAGQEAGEIGGQIDADETAGALLALMAGLRVLARGRPDPAVLCAVCRHADNMLR